VTGTFLMIPMHGHEYWGDKMSTVSNMSNLDYLLQKTNDPEEIRLMLRTMADTIGVERFRKKAVQEIIDGTQPERVIPDVYHPYRALVRDGIRFFLSHISFHRFLDVMVRQIQMDRHSTAEARLLELTKQFPTLHKLGQIIARNQNISPGIKEWLIQLENGQYGTALDTLLIHINSRLNTMDVQQTVHIEPFILSEASVGAVIPFKWHGDGDRVAIDGVFKVLKPNIIENLEEELAIFEKIAVYFEMNRQQYAFKDFRFLDVFEDVRMILKKEIDLVAEQSHLSEAARFFEGADDIIIPDLITLCDDTMTAMGYIEGEKITDAQLTEKQRRDCANILVESLICRPLFAADPSALFHGDPHAGNIMISAAEDDRQRVKIALLDWSLAGHLSQSIRGKIVRLIKSITLNDVDEICNWVRDIAGGAPKREGLSKSGVRRIVSKMTNCEAEQPFSLLKKTFRLLEEISYEGVVFPSDLMLFRKAIFTLEGVIYDICPQFDMDAFVFKYVAGLLAHEMPWRFGNVLFLQSDKAENYQSHLSNIDLQALILQQYTTLIQQNTRAAVELFDKQTQLMLGFFS
jgi:ubiquinone biosynthesis protein